MNRVSYLLFLRFITSSPIPVIIHFNQLLVACHFPISTSFVTPFVRPILASIFHRRIPSSSPLVIVARRPSTKIGRRVVNHFIFLIRPLGGTNKKPKRDLEGGKVNDREYRNTSFKRKLPSPFRQTHSSRASAPFKIISEHKRNFAPFIFFLCCYFHGGT